MRVLSHSGAGARWDRPPLLMQHDEAGVVCIAGLLHTWGRGERGRLGQGDAERVCEVPRVVEVPFLPYPMT